MSAQVQAELLGKTFRFTTAPGLFSADRVDDGTRLLLEHLPTFEPRRVLDLGCGYGALGLPIAARFPNARFVLADRDTLAVEFSRRNAESNGLTNVEARPSLGYRDVDDGEWDWVLCNVPARIGDQAIAYILGEGARRLAAGGELRVVVIRDLGPVVERIAAERKWDVQRRADGARHLIYSLGHVTLDAPMEQEAIYLRDRVSVGGMELERPHDISEDPGHLKDALPLLLELLPKTPPKSALVWRGGYGAAAITLAKRGSKVTVVDRDLLATTFTRRNAGELSLELREGWTLSEARPSEERFGLFVGEFHASAGEDANAADVLESVRLLDKGGQALWMGLTRQAKGWLERLVKNGRARVAPLASRGSWSVWRVELALKK